jgi:hypothetical protein
VPTFQLTVFVRALPAPGPVRVLQRAQLIAGQQFDETCFIWDAEGRLVAHSTQLAGIRFDGQTLGRLNRNHDDFERGSS